MQPAKTITSGDAKTDGAVTILAGILLAFAIFVGPDWSIRMLLAGILLMQFRRR